jgi:hypothetical protein
LRPSNGTAKASTDSFLVYCSGSNKRRRLFEALGWKRRRDYEALFAGLERLGQIHEANFEVYEALAAVRSVSVDFEYLRPDSEQHFKGRFRRAGKAYSFGYAVEVQAGVAQEGRASFEPGD